MRIVIIPYAIKIIRNLLENVNIFKNFKCFFIISLSEPTALQIEKEGFGFVVESLGKLGGEVPYTTYQSKKSYIKDNPNIIKGFSNAIQKGLDYTFSHSDSEIAAILMNYFPDITLNDLTEVVKRYRENDSWYRSTYISEEGFNRVQDIMNNAGELEKRASYNTLVNNKYAKK